MINPLPDILAPINPIFHLHIEYIMVDPTAVMIEKISKRYHHGLGETPPETSGHQEVVALLEQGLGNWGREDLGMGTGD